MGCNCNKRPITTRPILPEFPENCDMYPKRHKDKNFFTDYSDVEKQLVAEQLGFATGNVVVNNNPDEEDLTSKIQGSHKVISFKDKVYDPLKYSGYGRVYLRQNLVEKKLADCRQGDVINQLTQEMFQDKQGNLLDNTIFIIQYDYDLDGAFIELPENSILSIQGGSFTNGTFLLNNTTTYESFLDFDQIFNNVDFRNTWKTGTTRKVSCGLQYFDGREWQWIGSFNIDVVNSKQYTFYYGITDSDTITTTNAKSFKSNIINPKVVKFVGTGKNYFWIIPKIENKYISIYVNGIRNTDFDLVSDTTINEITYSIYKLNVDTNNEFDSNIIYTDK